MSVTALRAACDLLGGESFPKLESPSLRHDKFVRLDKNGKKDELAAVIRCHADHRLPIPSFRPGGAVSFAAALGGRLIVNQAGGILENAGLCLHRHFGDPYIPGSALKGLARHAAWLEWNAAEGAEKERLAQQIRRVFGDAQRSGCVAFLDAVPEGKPTLVVDIVNCHHPDYYAGKRPEATDNENPNPQFFPAVETGVLFRFTLVPLRNCGEEREPLLAQAKVWLLEALTVYGAGAKTAAGYGWFTYDAAKALREEAEAHAQEEREAEEARKQAKEEARIASLDPLAREMERLLKLEQEPFAHFAKALADKSEDERRAFVRLMRHPDKKDWWKTKRKKDASLADAIRAVAAQLKEELS